MKRNSIMLKENGENSNSLTNVPIEIWRKEDKV